jgi:hypothetical protein
MRATARLLLLLLIVGAASACGKPVDLTKGLVVESVSTGWYDAGVVDGQNKLVPSVSFTLKNVSDQTLSTLQVNAVFHRVSEPKDEWGTGFLTAVGSAGLAPNASTSTLNIKSTLGYKGTDPRETMLRNSQFVDAKVVLLAKYGSGQWTKIGDFPISRQLIAR